MKYHFVKLCYGNFMEDLQKEVNAFCYKPAFISNLATIIDIQIVHKGDYGIAIMIHYESTMEVV